MRKEWLCTRTDSSSFTKGQRYLLDSDGDLLDNDGDCRLPPSIYNRGTSKRFIKSPYKNVIGGELC